MLVDLLYVSVCVICTSLGGRGQGGSYGSLLRCVCSMLVPAEVAVPVLSWCWCWCPCPACTA